MSPRRRRTGLAGALVIAVLVVVVVAVVAGPGSGPPARRARPTPPPASTSSPAPETSSTTGTSPAAGAPAGQAFGVNVNRLFNDRTYTPAQIDAQLGALQATGATVARSDALWEATEPQAPVDGRHHYDWSFDDEIAGALAAHGLTWLPILDYSAPWAQSVPGQDHSPPRSDADYAAYAGAFAARYGAGGSFWAAHAQLPARPVQAIEIWNEPDNNQFWTPTPDAAAYARLYLAARAAIQEVDPAVRVLVGGLTDAPRFLPAMLRARPGLRGQIGGVAIHPYGPPAAVVAKVRRARATLDALGLGAAPLYVTEFGWTTSPPGALDYAPPAVRDRYITATLAALGHLDCGVAASLLYTWVTPERSSADSGDWYGIAAPGGGTTAAITAFTAGLRAAARPGVTRGCGR